MSGGLNTISCRAFWHWNPRGGEGIVLPPAHQETLAYPSFLTRWEGERMMVHVMPWLRTGTAMWCNAPACSVPESAALTEHPLCALPCTLF